MCEILEKKVFFGGWLAPSSFILTDEQEREKERLIKQQKKIRISFKFCSSISRHNHHHRIKHDIGFSVGPSRGVLADAEIY